MMPFYVCSMTNQLDGVLHAGKTDDVNMRALPEIPAFAGMSGKQPTPKRADGRAWP